MQLRFLSPWLLAALFTLCQCKIQPQSLSEIDEYRYDFIRLEQDLWNTVIDEQSNSISSKTSPEIDLIKSYKLFGDALEKMMPEDITYGVKPLENLWIWAKTYGELRSIYALYETFRRFQKLQTDQGRVPSPKQAWIDLAETILQDGKSSIPDSLKKVHEIVKNEKLFQLALQEAVFSNCEIKQSPQQLLYNLYKSVALTELKGYIMVQFAWQLFKLFNIQGRFAEEAQLMRHTYQERAEIMVDLAKTAMNKTTREIWKCDPKIHVKGETYTELTRLLQAHIENEIDMSPNEDCFKNCAYYDYAKSNRCYKNQYCSKQPKCRGKLLNCKYIDSDMWICPAARNSGRRYEYIEYENGRVLGRKFSCARGTTKVDSWWKYLFWHCSYCICLCDDDENSDRYFNLREYATDIDNNRVVTGLRFVKVNRVFHLQIQEGKLLPFGNIDNATIRWKPIDDYKLTDRNVKNGDYHKMSWEKRDLDLDNLVLTNNQLITGVRFRTLGTHLNLEIRATPFNFTTGTLLQPKMKSYWHSSDKSPLARKKLWLSSPDVSTRSHMPSEIDSADDQYVEFTNTDYDRDAGQTTVPFIDMQSVVSEFATPLSGAGIYHKGRAYFGGFIAPKIMTYDFNQHLGVVFPPEVQFHDLEVKDVHVN